MQPKRRMKHDNQVKLSLDDIDHDAISEIADHLDVPRAVVARRLLKLGLELHALKASQDRPKLKLV